MSTSEPPPGGYGNENQPPPYGQTEPTQPLPGADVPPPGGTQPPPYAGQQPPPQGFPQQGYPQPGYPMVDPSAPWGRDPRSGEPYGDKQKVIAGILNIIIPGVGRMVAGHVGIGIAQLVVAIVTCGIGAIWSFIDGIIILVSQQFRDGQGRLMRP